MNGCVGTHSPSCTISRRWSIVDGGLCPQPNCTDDSGNQAYAYWVEQDCSTNCSATCAEQYLTLRVVHDGCEDHPNVLTTEAKQGWQDMKSSASSSCGNTVRCNAVTQEESENELVCSLPSGAMLPVAQALVALVMTMIGTAMAVVAM